MKLIFCVALSLMLSSFNVVNSSVVREAEEQDNSNKTQLINLNNDCLFSIFEHLDLTDLLGVAKVYDQFSIVAANVFRVKYSHLQIVISDDFVYPATKSIFSFWNPFNLFRRKQKYYIQKTDTEIRLNKYDTVVESFENFGHFMKKLKLSSSVSTIEYSDEKSMANVVNAYISDSLVEVEFEHSTDSLLTQIAKPLVNVEKVRFDALRFHSDPEGLRLNELLPTVRRLELIAFGGDKANYFNCHMPNLEEFYIDGINLDAFNAATNCVINVIMNNPQIRDIELHGSFPAFVQKLAHLPQLERLTLSKFELLNGEIRFDNVNTFAMFDGSPENLHFSRLHNLHLHYDSDRLQSYLTFLNEHEHLKVLHVKEWHLNDEEFATLSASLNNLEELTFVHAGDEDHELTAAAVVQFLRSDHQLMQLNFVDFSNDFNVELQEQLNDDWHSDLTDGVLYLKHETKNQL